jgi:L-alanine-DL-glutamate epimerase-like enolase superfamily enzyme
MNGTTHTGAPEQAELRMAEPVKITAIRASIHTTSIAIPLLEGKVAGYGREEQKEFVFCEVETDKGVSGFGLTGHFLARSVVEALEKHVFPVVQGMDPRNVEAIHHRVWWKLNPRAMTGTISSALSCLDIACWDIAGKLAGRTVAELMGGHRTSVPAYVTYGFPQYDPRAAAKRRACMWQTGQGAENRRRPSTRAAGAEDARAVKAARAAVGDDITSDRRQYLFNPVMR